MYGLIEGKVYNFHTTDDTVYDDAVYLSGDADGVWIRTGKLLPVRVFIATHELAMASNAFGHIIVSEET